jgi:hypothetical protein
MKIYVASSWRNQCQPGVVEALRRAGHDVYDFRNPAPGNKGFHWSEIDANWRDWSPRDYRAALRGSIADQGFEHDMRALRECDLCVLVMPCGRSAHLEAGWAAGAGKRTIMYVPEPMEPELMVKMFDGGIVLSTTELLKEISK